MTAPGQPTRTPPAQVPAPTAEPGGLLTLFVSGASQLSALAIANARQLCDTHLAGRYHLRVIDIHEDPAVAMANQVIAAPTLMKHRPPPARKVVGDLSQPAKVLQALDLPDIQDTRTAHR